MCTIVLTYMLIFTDGHKEPRTKWVDAQQATEMVQQATNPEVLKELKGFGIDSITDLEVKEVPPYNCITGPK